MGIFVVCIVYLTMFEGDVYSSWFNRESFPFPALHDFFMIFSTRNSKMPEFQGLQRRGMPKYTPRINASYKYPTASDSQVGNPDSYTLFEKTNLDLDMLTVCLENMQRSFKIHSIAFACCKEALKIIRGHPKNTSGIERGPDWDNLMPNYEPSSMHGWMIVKNKALLLSFVLVISTSPSLPL